MQDLSSEEVDLLQHPLSVQFLGHGDASLREDLAAFTQGCTLESLPRLERAVAELAFVPLSERRQEADHALIHRPTQSKIVGGAYTSLILRLPEIEKHVWGRDDSSLGNQLQARLLEKLSLLSDANRFAKVFGFFDHPQYEELYVNKATNKQRLQFLQTLMYRLDAESKFGALAGPQEKRQQTEKRLQALSRQLTKQQAHQPTDAILRYAVIDHLRKTLVPGNYYSLPADCMHFLGLDVASSPLTRGLVTGGLQPADLNDDCLVSDTYSSGVPAATTQVAEAFWRRDLFLRVIRSHPSRAKLVNFTSVLADRLTASDMAVSLHKVAGSLPECEAPQKPVVESSPSQCCTSPIAVMACDRGDVKTVIQELRAWVASDMCYYFSSVGVRPAMPPLIEALFKAHCRGADVETMRTDSVQELEGSGLITVAASHGEGPVHCRLTTLGLGQVTVGRLLDKPHAVFTKVTGPGVPDVAGASAWQLLSALESRGWTMMKAPTSKRQRDRLPPKKPGVEACKVWYAVGYDLTRWRGYVESLLRSDALFEAGAVMIHHLQTKTYYKLLLAGKITGESTVISQASNAADASGLEVLPCSSATSIKNPQSQSLLLEAWS